MGSEFKFLINGQLVAGNVFFPVTNPSSLDTVADCPSASLEQVDAAVDAAVAAHPAWAALSLNQRKDFLLKAADILEENAEDLGKLLTAEQGKPLSKAGKTGEVSWAVAQLRKIVDETTLEPVIISETTKIYRRPLGVVAGITPWNFPIFCSMNKWVPSLLYGNTFVHKPSPFTPLTGLRIGELLKDHLPKGVFNVVSGNDQLEFNVGGHLSQHAKVNMVSFTGSVPTGRKIMASCSLNGMRRFALEAGGNDAAIVLPDCDPEEAIKGLFAGAFANSGQICCAIKRLYVHESIHDQIVEGLVREAQRAKFGDGMEPDTEFGPLNNQMQFDKVMGLIEDTKTVSGAKIECGGKKIEGHKGYFIEPTIVSGVKDGCRLVDEEQFGPVLPVIKYIDEADALRRANESDVGLGGSVWSSDIERAAKIGSQIQAGTIWINCHTDLTGGPFGGFKSSGIGRENCSLSDVESYTEMQTFYIPKPNPPK